MINFSNLGNSLIVKKSISSNSFPGMITNKDIFTKLFALSINRIMDDMKNLDHELSAIAGQINEI